MKHKPTITIAFAGLLSAAGTLSVHALQEQFRGLLDSGISTAGIPSNDISGQEFRQRAGIPGFETSVSAMPEVGAKGGMAKEPIVSNYPAMWEIFGGTFFYNKDYDNNISALSLRSNTDIEVFGGFVGAERFVNSEWRVGLTVAFSSADTDLGAFGSIDTETLTIMPHARFYREDAFGSADWWANFLYSYSDQNYDMVFAGPTSTDGEAHTLKASTGLNFSSGNVVHGPYAGFRYINGSIDNYLAIPSQDFESSVSILGYQVSAPIRLNGGTLVPQFRVAWEHDFTGGQSTVLGLPVAGNIEDVIVLGSSLGFYGDSGWNAVLSYEAQLADEVEGHYFGLKVGKEF